MAAVTPLAAVTFLPAEIAASQTMPSIVDLVGMQSSFLADLNEIIKNLNGIIAILPAGANKTTLQTLVTTLS